MKNQEATLNGTATSAVQAPWKGERNPFDLPYTSRFSFLPLVKKIQTIAASKTGKGQLAQQLLNTLEKTPEFLEPIDDLKLLEKHNELTEWLFSYVIPQALCEKQIVKIAQPFSPSDLYISPAMAALMEGKEVEYVISQNDNVIYCAATLRACTLILNKYYDQNLDIDPPLKVQLKETKKSLPRFFRPEMDFEFVDIKLKGELPELSEEKIEDLIANVYDTKKWMDTLPLDVFEFHGFVIINLVDITEEEALSQIKHLLLKPDAVLHEENIQKLQTFLRIYLGISDLSLGLTAIDFPIENKVAHQYKIRFDFLADEVDDLLHPDFAGSIYERVCNFRNVLLIEDLQKLENPTALEQKLLVKGIRSLIVATLVNQDNDVVGIVELASKKPYALHSFIELKFREISRLFRTALQRSREEVDNALEAIIREKYTALHPSIEWRFMESAFDILHAREAGKVISDEDNPIVFKDIYPLYGQADIVGSSTKRNASIQQDLIDQLNLAKTVLEKSLEQNPLPLINQILLHLNRELNHLEDHFNSNDETRIIELLQTEIEPILKQLGAENGLLRSATNNYFDQLDKELGVIYNHRKNYEQSVETINETIGNYMDEQEVKMQQTLPHYFERYKTDGVEYEMYLGPALLQQKNRFSAMHLRNFRLTQLIQMCEITRKVESMKKELPEALTTAQLVFAYTSQLSVRFRMDEKRFDVDGAYNVRYEILKKRIDKAVIEGTTNRLTRSGHVAIVYLHEKDRQEYLDYADYLLYEGFIAEPPEDLVLAPLQGVDGLRALRLKVKL